MKSCYPHLLSPLKIGGTMLKNRLIGSAAIPHYLMGPETFPGEQLINHIASVAKAGASVVVINDLTDKNQRKVGNIDGRHFPSFDLEDDSVLNYMSQLADTVHYYNTKMSLLPSFFPPKGLYLTDMPAVTPEEALAKAPTEPAMRLRLMSGDFGPWRGMTEEEIEAYTESVAQRVRFYQLLGFDMCTIHMAYCMTFFSQCLSPLANHRTDKFGGSLENRARLPLMLFRRIKELCGRDFLIEVEISGQEPEGGLTTEDIIEFGRMAEGLIDIFQIRDDDLDRSQPVPFNAEPGEYRTIVWAEKMKKAGVPQMIEVVGGYQDMADAERFLAEGKCDLIALARSFIADPDLIVKLREGRPEDITPCIRCNRCHGLNLTGPWLTVCSVNPEIGLAHKIERMNRPAGVPKKIAVIGGGPAGMKAAITAADRGHHVTIFEKGDTMGGQLFHADYVGFKWTLKRYRDFLVAQVSKRDIEVRLNTLATPEMIEAEDFDVVLAAVGAVQKKPNIPGAEEPGVLDPLQIYSRESELGDRIVVVGGGETGAETALYLAEMGKHVTLLSRQKQIAPHATPTHYRSELIKRMERCGRLSILTGAKTASVTAKQVVFEDDAGSHTLSADTVILSGGVRALQDEAAFFYGSAPVFEMIGDCRKPGNIQTCTRDAYAAACQI